MPELNNSKTLENLHTAFAGESMAHVKYNFFSSRAKKDGYVQISELFKTTADNEKEHAEIWYKLINGDIADTAENLRLAAEGENHEWTQMYKEFAETAGIEGFDKIAETFAHVGDIEKDHEERYLNLLQNIKEGKVFSRDGVQVWICRNCGHVHVAENAPAICPVCSHAIDYFELRVKNY